MVLPANYYDCDHYNITVVFSMTTEGFKKITLWLLWRQRRHRRRRRCRRRNFASRRSRRQSQGRYTRTGRTRAKASHWNGTALRRRHGTEKNTHTTQQSQRVISVGAVVSFSLTLSHSPPIERRHRRRR